MSKKFNEIELKLFAKIMQWYYANYKDKEVLDLKTKTTFTKEDKEKIKDIMREYHQKTGLGGPELHKVEASIFAKLGKTIKTTDEKMRIKKQKEIEKERKAAEKAKKKAEAEKKKKQEKAAKKKAEADEKAKKAQDALEKGQYTIEDVFGNIELKDE